MGLRKGMVLKSYFNSVIFFFLQKGIPENQAIIISAKDCFHGRTIAIVSMSTDPDCKSKFGPFLPGLVSIDYNNAEALK
jgi:ornithine--oxo-acid transaminase